MNNKLDVSKYDPIKDTITIEGTTYSAELFRNLGNSEAMIGKVLRIDGHRGGVVTVTDVTEKFNQAIEGTAK